MLDFETLRKSRFSNVGKNFEAVLSFAQKRMFVLSQLEGVGTSYNMPGVSLLKGYLDRSRLEDAFRALVVRHDSLRTSFHYKDEEPVQMIHPDAELVVEDLGCLDESNSESSDVNTVIANMIREFDLSRAPLLRVGIFRLSEEEHLLVTDIHHIISDGLSIEVLLRELGMLYKGDRLPNLLYQYKDYAIWQHERFNNGDLGEQEAYWLNRFTGEIPLLDLPTDYKRPPVRGFEGAVYRSVTEPELATRLKELAGQIGSSVYVVLLTAFHAFLYKYTGQEDIIVGTPIAGRTNADFENMIGMFVNTLPIRSCPSKEKTFRQLLSEVKDSVLEAYRHQEYPFEELVAKLKLAGGLSRNPLFDTVFVSDRLEQEYRICPELSVLPKRYENGRAIFDLTLYHLDHKDGMSFEWSYNKQLFTEETIIRMASNFINVLRCISNDIELALSDISLISEDEEAQLLSTSKTFNAQYPRTATLQAMFEEQVLKTPENCALELDGKQITYRQLNERANQLARMIRNAGVHSDSIVAILMDRSFEMILSILGVLKAGGAYLPINPDYPKERLEYLLTDSGAEVLLTTETVRGDEYNPDGLLKIIIVDSNEQPEETSIDNPEPINGPESLAYIIYTSGTTGNPKGVMIEHRNVISLMLNSDLPFCFAENDVWTLFHSYSFDFSVWEIFGALLFGGKLVIVPRWVAQDTNEFLHLLERKRVTVLNQTPTAFYNLLSHLKEREAYPDLQIKYVIFGGESLKPYRLKEWRTIYPNTKLINMYGITETTVHVTYKELSEEDIRRNRCVIGRKLGTLSLYILDHAMHPVPVGISGEMYVGGEGVARGYLNRPDLSRQRFIPSPFEPGKTLYRTGDLARYSVDGEIEYLGRMDHQVKIRGFRIETTEVEFALQRHPDVVSAVVIVREEDDRGASLVAGVTTVRKIQSNELKKFVSGLIPAFMIPSQIVFLEEIPVTSNGKVDRRALLTLAATGVELRMEVELPQNKIEERLVDIWRTILGMEQIGVSDNFFEIGGHSLKATELVQAIKKAFRTGIGLRKVFERPTIRELADCISSDAFKQIKDIPSAPAGLQSHLVSAAQRRLYILEQMRDIGAGYNITGVSVLEGRVNRLRMEDAFQKLIRRHESLRTSFELRAGEPVQIIQDQVDFSLSEELNPNGYDEKSPELLSLIRKSICPFDLSRAPLFQACIIRLSDEKHLLVTTMHHIVSDGISIEILIRDFVQLYEGMEIPPINVQYKDYSHWQNELIKKGEYRQQELYWLDRFSGEIPVLNLPTSNPRPTLQQFKGNSYRFTLEAELVNRLKALADQNGTTMYMVLLAAYNVLLHKYTGQEDIIVGSPIAGRQSPDLMKIIGMFVNMLALRNQPSKTKTFRQLLLEVKENAIAAYEHQDYPFEELVSKLNLARDLSRHPLFDTVLVVQNHEQYQNRGFRFGELAVSDFPLDVNTSQYDLSILCSDTREGEISVQMVYSCALFEEQAICRMSSHWYRILMEVSNRPDLILAEISMLTDAEQDQLLTVFNRKPGNKPITETIVEMFERQVEKTPNRDAVRFEQCRFSYEQINRQANKLARLLQKKGVHQNKIVALCFERSVEMNIAILGVLKAGGAYVPVDPELPADRIQFIINDSDACLCLAQQHLYDKTRSFVQTIPFPEDAIDEEDTNLASKGTNLHLAYVIYTSGTSGNPKGVLIEHGSIANSIAWRKQEYGLDHNDRVLQLFSYSFDGFMTSFFTPIVSGSTVILLSGDDAKDPSAILHTIKREQVTHFICVPSLFGVLIDLAEPEDIRSVNVVTLAGEAVHPRLIEETAAKNERLELVNEYGPTEAAVVATFQRNIRSSDKITIGVPIDGTRVYITNEANQLQPIGVPGELCIAGSGVARGYVGLPDLERAKFINEIHYPGGRVYRTGDQAKWLDNGTIELLGRIDEQVKVSGYRIELSDVEHALRAHTDVQQAAVVDKQIDGNTVLCAYVVSQREDVGSLRAHAANRLPAYMLPSYYVFMNQLPIMSNGKVNRLRLKNMDIEVPEYQVIIHPVTELERQIAEAWKVVLSRNSIDVTRNFFDLGGNSLRLMQAYVLLEKRFPGKLKITDLFKHVTVQAIASFMEKGMANVSLESLQDIRIHKSFFGESTVGSASILEAAVSDEQHQTLLRFSSEKHIEIADLFLAVYADLLLEIATDDHIVFYAIQSEKEGFLRFSIPKGQFGDVWDMAVHVNKLRLQGTESIPINNLGRRSKRGNDAIVALIVCGGHPISRDHIEESFDIVMEFDKHRSLSIRLDYNYRRLKVPMMKQFMKAYLETIHDLAVGSSSIHEEGDSQ